jgi:uncharacterized protein YaiI (UPF0178 family)
MAHTTQMIIDDNQSNDVHESNIPQVRWVVKQDVWMLSSLLISSPLMVAHMRLLAIDRHHDSVNDHIIHIIQPEQIHVMINDTYIATCLYHTSDWFIMFRTQPITLT